MPHPTRRLFLITLLTAVCLAAPIRLRAQGTINFTGDFAAPPSRPGSAPAPRLHVVQAGNKIDITRTDRGKGSTSHFLIDGPEGVYTSPAGIAGKGQAKLDGQYLLIQSIVENKPQPTAPTMHVRIRERWALAPDRKALKIDFSVDFPGLSSPPPQTWTEDFTRVAR